MSRLVRHEAWERHVSGIFWLYLFFLGIDFFPLLLTPVCFFFFFVFPFFFVSGHDSCYNALVSVVRPAAAAGLGWAYIQCGISWEVLWGVQFCQIIRLICFICVYLVNSSFWAVISHGASCFLGG